MVDVFMDILQKVFRINRKMGRDVFLIVGLLGVRTYVHLYLSKYICTYLISSYIFVKHSVFHTPQCSLFLLLNDNHVILFVLYIPNHDR